MQRCRYLSPQGQCCEGVCGSDRSTHLNVSIDHTNEHIFVLTVESPLPPAALHAGRPSGKAHGCPKIKAIATARQSHLKCSTHTASEAHTVRSGEQKGEKMGLASAGLYLQNGGENALLS